MMSPILNWEYLVAVDLSSTRNLFFPSSKLSRMVSRFFLLSLVISAIAQEGTVIVARVSSTTSKTKSLRSISVFLVRSVAKVRIIGSRTAPGTCIAGGGSTITPLRHCPAARPSQARLPRPVASRSPQSTGASARRPARRVRSARTHRSVRARTGRGGRRCGDIVVKGKGRLAVGARGEALAGQIAGKRDQLALRGGRLEAQQRAHRADHIIAPISHSPSPTSSPAALTCRSPPPLLAVRHKYNDKARATR